MAPFHVWWECALLAVECVYKRIYFVLFPEQRKRDLEKVTESYNLMDEGKKKYLGWRNAETVQDFFYTWNMVTDHFYT